MNLKVFSLITVIIFSGCTNLIYHPDRYLHGDPRAFQLDLKEYFVKSFDGTKLLFWDLKSTKNSTSPSENLILMLHGNAQNMSSHIFNLTWALDHKTDLMTFDYRGYGLSEGSPYPKGTVEDALKALFTAYDKYKAFKYKRLIFYAQSLGGSILMRALEEFPFKDEIFLVVLDSAFYSPQDIASYRTFGMLGFIVSNDYTAKNADHLSMPVLVIHSKQDQVIPFQFGEKIFKDIKHDKKEFWALEKGNHGDVFYLGDEYKQKFLTKINAN